MKLIKEQTFERELPSGYRQAKYINAKDLKFGIVFNLIALVIFAVVMAIAVLFLLLRDRLFSYSFIIEGGQFILAYMTLFVGMLGYVVLHELVHGIAYKRLTGEKLTFGISWSCAFCGVPHILTYRRTAMIAVVAPFVVFTSLFIPILVILYFVHPLYYLVVAFIFGSHLGGCSGDLYVLYLLKVKFKDAKTLMRDTGPEQYFYIPDEEKFHNT